MLPKKEDDKGKESETKLSSDVTNPDPSAPIQNKGILTSFVTGKKMPIPEHDVVRFKNILFFLEAVSVFNSKLTSYLVREKS